MCDGSPRIFTISVNPVPKVVPSGTEQIICDNGTTNIILGSPSTFTSGVVTFNYTATATGGVTGYTASATGLPNNHVITDVLVNPTDAPQTVIYTITPVSPVGCNNGPSVNVTVTVNPTPRIFPVPANSIQCDSTTTNITLESPSTFTSGVVTFKYTATATGGMTGFTASATGLPDGHIITDKLIQSYGCTTDGYISCNTSKSDRMHRRIRDRHHGNGESDTEDISSTGQYDTVR